MRLHEYARYDAVGLRNLIRSGEVTAEEVETAARAALAAVNPQVNGLALPVFEPALHHAADGPFAGVPFLIKDHGPVAGGVPFFLGSRALPGVVARHDTDLMARFRAAGLATLGLTTVPEMCVSFATEPLRHGPTRNPWDMAYEFALTRTVRDAAHLLDAVHGPGIGDKYTAPPPRRRYADELGADPARLRVAVTTEAWSGTAVDAQVAAAAVRTGKVLEGMGHAVSTAGPEVDWEAVLRAWVLEGVAVSSTLLLAPREPDPAMMEAVSRRFLRTAREYTALDMMAAFDAQNRVTRSVSAFLTAYDLLVTPTLGRLPLPHGTLRQDDPGHTLTSWLESLTEFGPFTVLFNITGHPAISLPLGTGDGGLPIGVQIVAPYGREDLLFQVAARLEEAVPWQDRTPPVFAGNR